MRTVEAFAPAKINLTLHVTGQRPDGYHELDSLVAFASAGDTVVAEEADDLSLKIRGPFANGLVADDNLVLHAARLLSRGRGASLLLTKRLPVASGIGGGSADAAAAIRALCALWGAPWPDVEVLAQLGADVPVCLRSELTRMRGIGDKLDRFGPTPRMGLLLVNPGIAVSTRQVFEALAQKDNPPMSDPVTPRLPERTDFSEWIDWLARQRNDLEAPAVSMCPTIGEVLAKLRALPGCLLARMSGSGATCFAVFEDGKMIEGTERLKRSNPEWWVQATSGLSVSFNEESSTVS